MVEDKKPCLPETVSRLLSHLRESESVHHDFLEKILIADQGNLFPQDLVVMAALQRSLALTKGFCLMVETQNITCAAPLLRCQIDSAMRFYALNLVDSPEPLLLALFKGRPLKKIKSRTGEALTDWFLRKELSKHFPWADRVYETTSGFVHLSQAHMHALFGAEKGERTVEFRVGSDRPEWPEAQMIEAVQAFTESTKMLLQLAFWWQDRKEAVGRERKEKRG